MSATLVARVVEKQNADIGPMKAGFHTQYLVIAALTILLYDYVLTFLNEVSWIWRAQNKRNSTIVLYFLNRYFTILSIPIVIIQYFWQNTNPDRLKTCLTVNKVHYYVIVFSQVVVAAVLILRAYALYGKSRRVLALTCVITLVAASLAIWSVATAPTPRYTPSDLLSKGTCMLPTYLATVERYMSSIIVAMILELVIFVLIVCKSIQHIKSRSVILEVLLRDGLFYFAMVTLAHLGVILSYYLPKDASRGNLATLANCLNSTLISRLILHLRNPALNPEYQATTQATQGILSTVVLTDGRDGSTQGSLDLNIHSKWESSTRSYSSSGSYSFDLESRADSRV